MLKYQGPATHATLIEGLPSVSVKPCIFRCINIPFFKHCVSTSYDIMSLEYRTMNVEDLPEIDF